MTVEGSFRPVIVQFTQELLRQHCTSDGTFRIVQQRLGNAGVVDLLMLISALEVMPGAPSALSY